MGDATTEARCELGLGLRLWRFHGTQMVDMFGVRAIESFVVTYSRRCQGILKHDREESVAFSIVNWAGEKIGSNMGS